ncbi:MAG TPA: hypothetical protein VGM39_20190 [Kofleriaceae bacterium]
MRWKSLSITLCSLVSTVAVAQTAADTAPPTTDQPLIEEETTKTPEPPPTPRVVAAPAPPPEDPNARPAAAEGLTIGKTRFVLDGYLQPQFRVRQNGGPRDYTNGFRANRIRPQLRAYTTMGDLELSATFESELQPTFAMVDAYASIGSSKLPGNSSLVVDVGQMRVPFSRAQLLSDARSQFVDKSQIQSIAPGDPKTHRDLGARVTYVLPGPANRVKVMGGVFNGEGQDQIENIDEKFLYAGRLEFNVLGHEGTQQEGSFGDDYLTIGGSIAHYGVDSGDQSEKDIYVGGDIAGSWHGISGEVEYLEVHHNLRKETSMDYHANGWNAQLAYLLPIKLWHDSQIEIAGRVEEIDRNDTTPIAQPGDPEQSQRIYTANVTYYLRKHSTKLQAAYYHFTEIEDLTQSLEDASYPNDQLLVQLTYRME